MRAVVQRVKSSKVEVDGQIKGKVNKGLMVLLGVTHEDTKKDVDYMVDKILKLRIFEDEDEKMNKSLIDIDGELLVVSQFTLFGDCRKGKRPSFSNAAKPDYATQLYEDFLKKSKELCKKVESGEFGANMQVDILNDGPVTMLIDSKKLF